MALFVECYSSAYDLLAKRNYGKLLAAIFKFSAHPEICATQSSFDKKNGGKKSTSPPSSRRTFRAQQIRSIRPPVILNSCTWHQCHLHRMRTRKSIKSTQLPPCRVTSSWLLEKNDAYCSVLLCFGKDDHRAKESMMT